MKIVCLCGIDGGGKSTIVNRLKASVFTGNIIFKSFNYRDNVKKFITQNPDIDTASINLYPHSVKELLVEAYVKDFFDFYELEIAPLRDTNKIILCERWFHCILAFKLALLGKSENSETTFSEIEKGELIFHITLDPQIAYKRQMEVDVVSKKSLSLLQHYQKGYSDYFEANNLNYFKLQNDNVSASVNIILRKLAQLTSK